MLQKVTTSVTEYPNLSKAVNSIKSNSSQRILEKAFYFCDSTEVKGDRYSTIENQTCIDALRFYSDFSTETSSVHIFRNGYCVVHYHISYGITQFRILCKHNYMLQVISYLKFSCYVTHVLTCIKS
jgi:hypothetical protein